MAACLLASCGLDMGPRAAVAGSVRGPCSFRDGAARISSEGILARAALTRPGGLPPLGWWPGFAASEVPQQVHESLAAAVAERIARSPSQGWKDCFATLLLDTTDRAADQPFWVFAYRYPWDVADALQRTGHPDLLANPRALVPAWQEFNQRVLDFTSRYRERCLLVHAGRLVRNPEEFCDLARHRFHCDSLRNSEFHWIQPDWMQTIEGDDPLIWHFERIYPEALRLLSALDEAADLSAKGRWRPRKSPNAASQAVDSHTPPLTVVIPCFNDGASLPEAVASVERSAPTGTEILVVNDGSTEPHTEKALAVLREAGYVVVDQPRSTPGAARNHGFHLARSPFVLPLDADDRLREGFAQAAVAAMAADPSIGVVYGDWYEFGLRTGRRRAPPFRLEKLLIGNFIAACALIRKQAWETADGYDPAIPSWQDWEFWITVAERGWQFHRLPDDACSLTFDYRIRPGSAVSAAADEATRQGLFGYIIEKHHEFYSRHLPGIMAAAWDERTLLQAALEATQVLVQRHRAGRSRVRARALVRRRQRGRGVIPPPPSTAGHS